MLLFHLSFFARQVCQWLLFKWGLNGLMGINLSMYRAAIGAFSGKSFRFSKSKISVRLLFLFSYLVITLLNLLFSILLSPNILLTLTIRLSVSNQRPARMKRFVFAHLFKPLCFFMWLYIFSLINRMLLIKAGIEPILALRPFLDFLLLPSILTAYWLEMDVNSQ